MTGSKSPGTVLCNWWLSKLSEEKAREVVQICEVVPVIGARLNCPGISPETLNHTWTAIFPLSQERNACNYAEVRSPSEANGTLDESTMTVLAVGDATTNPHFMTGSGLSSGLLTLNAAEELIHSRIHPRTGEEPSAPLAHFDTTIDQTSKLALKKGSAFLTQHSAGEQQASFQRRMRADGPLCQQSQTDNGPPIVSAK